MNLIKNLVVSAILAGLVVMSGYCAYDDNTMTEYYDAEKSALIDALDRNDSDRDILALFGYGVDVNYINPKSVQGGALHIAAKKNRPGIVKKLLQHGAFVNVTSADGDTPLHMAAKHAAFECMKLLIDAGANPNAVNDEKYTPLAFVMSKNPHLVYNYNPDSRQKCASLLINAGAEPNEVIDKDTGKTPLLYFVRDNQLKMVELLLKKGANPNIQTMFGDVPLIIAYNTFTNSPHTYEKYQAKEIMASLLNSGADPNVYYNSCPIFIHFMWNSDQDNNFDLAQLFINKGANKDATYSGKTCLMFVAEQGKDKYVDLLIKAGANIEAVDMYGETALHKAAESGSHECVKLLIEAGANIQAVNKNGTTPLHKAAEWGNAECAKLLLTKGAKLDAIDAAYKKPEQYAESSEMKAVFSEVRARESKAREEILAKQRKADYGKMFESFRSSKVIEPTPPPIPPVIDKED